MHRPLIGQLILVVAIGIFCTSLLAEPQIRRSRMTPNELKLANEKLKEWAVEQINSALLSEAELHQRFSISKEDLEAEELGWTPTVCSDKGCAYTMTVNNKTYTLWIMRERKGQKAILMQKDSEENLTDEKPTAAAAEEESIRSVAELEKRLEEEENDTVILLFSSSIKKQELFFYPVDEKVKLWRKEGNDALKAVDPASLPMGKMAGEILIENEKKQLSATKNLVKGPITENGNIIIPEGQLATQESGKHCPPCRLLDGYLSKFKSVNPKTSIYLVDTRPYALGQQNSELETLKNKFIENLGWPNGVVLERHHSSKKVVGEFGVKVEGADAVPDYIVKNAFPDLNATWKAVRDAHLSNYR